MPYRIAGIDVHKKMLAVVVAGLERHSDVGSVLSIALLMAEAERPWYSLLFSWETRL